MGGGRGEGVHVCLKFVAPKTFPFLVSAFLRVHMYIEFFHACLVYSVYRIFSSREKEILCKSFVKKMVIYHSHCNITIMLRTVEFELYFCRSFLIPGFLSLCVSCNFYQI